MDTISESRLAQVNPLLDAKIHAVAEAMEHEGYVLRVTQGMRTWLEQDGLYAQGRTLPGQIVTNAKGGESWHNFGCAVDLVPMEKNLPDWNVMHPVWQRMVAIGKLVGLYSGSDFVCIKDWPHFQLTGRFGVSPDNEARQIYLEQGAAAFWGTIQP